MARPMTMAMVALLVAATGCTSGDATDTTTSTVPAAPSTVATTSTTSTTQPTTTSTTTTTLPEPPRLEVLDPAHGTTVTTARYTFSGVTDPGCAVTVGEKYEATVEEDGSWALDLMLEPGRNSTTFTATHPDSGLVTSQAIRVYYADAVELRGDGLGAVSFGDDETTTMDVLTGLLGPPVTESTCADDDFCTGAGYGWCTYIHHAHWPDQELSIIIADCEEPDEPPYTATLIGWTAGGQTTLRTPEGVGPGSTLGELQAVYGDRLRVGWDDCGGGFTFTARLRTEPKTGVSMEGLCGHRASKLPTTSTATRRTSSGFSIRRRGRPCSGPGSAKAVDEPARDLSAQHPTGDLPGVIRPGQPDGTMTCPSMERASRSASLI